MSKYILAHDLGTSGNKATLYTVDGKLVKSITYSYGLHVAAGGVAEQDPEQWWQAVCETGKALAELVPASDIAAVSFSGQMMGCVCVGEDMKPLRPAMIWADMRSTAQEARVRAGIGEKEFYDITGHRISSSYSATKLMWVKDNEPDIYKKTVKMLNAKDYMILRLTGQLVTEPSDASSTCLFDLTSKEWSDDILSVCGIDKDKLPDILASSDVAGTITKEASEQCGIPCGTPVVCGGGDGACAAVGSGAVCEGQANCCLGTSSWISYAAKAPVFDENMTTFNFAHVVPGYVLPTGTMQCGGGALGWIFDTICKYERALTKEEISALYEKTCNAAAASPVGAKGLVFLPYLMGERSPRWNSEAKGAFVGLTMEHGAGDIFRSVMEGVAMNLSVILETFQKKNAGIERLTLVGGGARNGIWRQILADILGVFVAVPNYLEEATSMGAAITAGVGIGAFSDFNVIDKFLNVESTYAPNIEAAPKYNELKRIFDGCYEKLLETYSALDKFNK